RMSRDSRSRSSFRVGGGGAEIDAHIQPGGLRTAVRMVSRERCAAAMSIACANARTDCREPLTLTRMLRNMVLPLKPWFPAMQRIASNETVCAGRFSGRDLIGMLNIAC